MLGDWGFGARGEAFCSRVDVVGGGFGAFVVEKGMEQMVQKEKRGEKKAFFGKDMGMASRDILCINDFVS